MGLRPQVRLPSGVPLLDEPVRGGLQESIVSACSSYASKQRLPDVWKSKAKGEEQMDLDALSRSRKLQPMHTERARFSLSYTPLLRTP